MMMNSLIPVFAVWCVLSPTAIAQTGPIDKGNPEDLRGATSLFVDTGARTDLRDAIIANLQKELPEVKVVAQVEEASLVVRFSTTIAPRGSALEQSDTDRRLSFPQRSTTVRPVPPPAPTASERQAGTARAEMRMPGSDRPDQMESARSRSETFDVLRPDENDTPREYRYAIGAVLKQSAANRYSESFSYVKRVEADTVHAVRDFVKKFAKAYRKANPKSS
jgi:hypothetical protein